MENAAPTPPETGDHAPDSGPATFALVPQPNGLGVGLLRALLWGPGLGFLSLGLLRGFVSEPVAIGLALAWSLVVGTLVSLRIRASRPDHLLLTDTSLALCRGPRMLRAVRLPGLAEVRELRLEQGRLLVLADDRHSLVVDERAFERTASYDELAAGVVSRLDRLDPSGELGRRAVSTGRLREELSRTPARGLAVFLLVLLPMALVSRYLLGAQVADRPFPLEAVGAVSAALVRAGELWRLVASPFVAADPFELQVPYIVMIVAGARLERLAGWERALLAFVVGTLGGGLAHVLTGSPSPVHGAAPGAFGLIGLLLAVLSASGRGLPRSLLPRWSLLVLILVLGAFVPTFGAGTSLVGLGGGLASGFVVGLAMVAGAPLPATDGQRQAWRPFAVLAMAALGVGLFGSVTHARRPHADDDAIVLASYLMLPEGPAAAVIQNNAAYPMLVRKRLSDEGLAVATRLAEAAVRNSEGKSSSILDTLAVARWRRGRMDEARELLDEAIKVEPDERERTRLRQRREQLEAGNLPDAE